MFKIGTVISPRYDLTSIFFYDYHQVLKDLSKFCDIFLAGNILTKPIYADRLLSLKPHWLSIFLHNRYTIPLSNLFSIFGYVRKGLEMIYDRYILKNLVSFFKKQNSDILYLFPRYPNSYHLWLSEELPAKIVVEFWEDQIEHLCQGLETSKISRKYLELERVRGYKWLRHTLQKSDCVIVPTVVLKQRLISLGGRPDRIFIVPVCQHPILQRNPSYIRQKHDLKTENVLLYVGSLASYHDLTTVFLALNRMKSVNVALLIAGGKEGIVNEYRKLLRNTDVRVIYVGRPDTFDLENYIYAADICLGIYTSANPSGFFPASVIKYMLAGKPIVATDLPEIREMFKGLKAGLLIKQNDVNDLASAIDFLLENNQEGIKMGTNARKIAENNYLWKHHTNTLVKIFNSL
ncbi:MAG: glycosyltransferase family 4 protein [Candidatus Hodarchaeota archaeon]